MKSLVVSAVGVLFSSLFVFGQVEGIDGGPVNVPAEGIVDGIYIKEHVPTKRLVPYEHIREADAMWEKRVWRYIDTREKINHPLYYPLDEVQPYGWIRNNERYSLWTIIRQHVMSGKLTVFSPFNEESYGFGKKDGDQLKYPIKPEAGKDFFTDSSFRDRMRGYIYDLGAESDVALVDENGDYIMKVDPVTGVESFTYEAPDTVHYTSKDIIQYRIKENWVFDKERSMMDVRIIALAPVVYKTKKDANGNTQIEGMKELFWLYFPHCRFVFNNYFTYNDKNDAQWMSYDDLFWKRKFNSVIYKSSNNYDRHVETYRVGVDALHESEKVKNSIRDLEHNMWSF